MDDSKPKTHPAGDGDGEISPAGDRDTASLDTIGDAVVQAFEEELADANRRADENWDRYLRAEADLDNLRRASERRRVDVVEAERRRLLSQFLTVADNLERSLAIAGSDAETLRTGVEATDRALRQMLDSEGVVEIEAMEQPFDPNLHEAVSVVTVPGLEGERVVAVERPGYTVGGSLLRAARVIVGRPPESGSAE